MQLSVVILAAGQGTRMNSGLPKVLQRLAGRPMLEHVILTARELAPDDVYVVYGHGGAQVQAALARHPVDWVLQSQQLGTGHAVMQALPVIPDDHVVLVLYGDVPLIGVDCLLRLVAAAAAGSLAVLSAVPADATGYGRVVRDAAGRVRAIVEHRDADSAQLGIREVNTGLMAAAAGSLRGWLLGLTTGNAQGEYLLTDVVAAAVLADAEVVAIHAEDIDEVMGINDRAQLAQAETIYRRRRAGELMKAGATLADPARIDVRGEVNVGRDVFIDVNAVLEGVVRLGARVSIGPHCVIRDAVIGDGTEIKSHTVIEGASLGENCRVGPFARLRPGTALAEDVHIGNYVEIKNTHIGAGSKVNHLSYLGDADVGRGVNVGAGTITCNYDGVAKWRTTIEDGAFIGSGSMLVAPVRIGANATIGAGSTITQDAAGGTLTLARSRQITVDGWRRPVKPASE